MEYALVVISDEKAMDIAKNWRPGNVQPCGKDCRRLWVGNDLLAVPARDEPLNSGDMVDMYGLAVDAKLSDLAARIQKRFSLVD